MNRAVENRPEPEILRLLPPSRKPIAWAYPGLFAVLMFALAFLFSREHRELAMSVGILLASLGVIAIVCALLQRRASCAFNRHRAEYAQRYPDAFYDEAVWNALHAICNANPQIFARPEPAGREFAREDRAIIYVAGMFDVPTATDDLFEPVILTPARYQIGNIAFCVAMVFGAIWVGWEWWHGRMGTTGPDAIIFPVTTLGTAALLGSAFYTLILRSTYVRMAPGLIQFVSFKMFNRQPQIRDYPMASGTTVIVGAFDASNRVFYISRGGEADRIPLFWMLGRQQAIESLWRAMMSTAPTPPLSEDSLVG